MDLFLFVLLDLIFVFNNYHFSGITLTKCSFKYLLYKNCIFVDRSPRKRNIANAKKTPEIYVSICLSNSLLTGKIGG
jgi:hypothetical protein